jgi:uncharacterized membrane protein YozB (DUF420 family)
MASTIMLDVHALPTLNATLNATAAVLLVWSYAMIRRRRIPLHRAGMIAASATSLLFLTSYVVYHAQVGSHPFEGHGPIRAVYLAILLSHVLLAAAIVPLVAVTLTRGLRRHDALHRRIARWTLPLWLYVSVTGVLIYLMLYG